MALEDWNWGLNYFLNGSHMATAPGEMRPLWILLLNRLSEAHKEEALGIFFLKVVCLLCCFSLIIFCRLLHVKNCLVKNLEDMSNSWKLEMEKKRTISGVLCFFPHLHPSSFLDFFLTGVATQSLSVGQCHHTGSSWFSSGSCSLTETMFRWGLSRVASQCLRLLSCQVEPDGLFPEGWGKGRRSGKGTDRRGSRRLGGEKLNKQGNRCLNSFWLLSKAAVYLEQWGMLNFPLTPAGWWLCSDRSLHPLLWLFQ